MTTNNPSPKNTAKKSSRVLFIGGGNMAESIIGGLVQNQFPSKSISVSEPNKERCVFLKKQYRVQIDPLLSDLNLSDYDAIILAIKPQIMPLVLTELATQRLTHLKTDKNQTQAKEPLFISIAAGTTTSQIEAGLHAKIPLIRCMPNTPALIQAGVTALFSTQQVSSQQKMLAESIMASVGTVLWVTEESQIDSVTAISGSGPAYFFYLMEAMMKAAEDCGLSADQSETLVLETALGAAKLAKASNISAAKLRQQVTSPGGTTEAAIKHLDQAQVKTAMVQAVQAAYQRSLELSQAKSTKA